MKSTEDLMNVGSLASSASSALVRGFESLNRAATKMSSAGQMPSGEMTAEEIALASEKEDGLVSGVMDLSMAKLQVGTGTALMKVYRDTTGTLLDMMG
jgi:hypothetical protein